MKSERAIRVIGILVAALGACGVAGTTIALFSVPVDEQLRFWIGTGLVYCLMLTAAGVGIALLRPWGFLLLMIVSVLLVVLPWITTLAGFVRFVYEPPGVIETICYIAVAVGCWFGYRRLRRAAPAS